MGSRSICLLAAIIVSMALVCASAPISAALIWGPTTTASTNWDLGSGMGWYTYSSGGISYAYLYNNSIDTWVEALTKPTVTISTKGWNNVIVRGHQWLDNTSCAIKVWVLKDGAWEEAYSSNTRGTVEWSKAYGNNVNITRFKVQLKGTAKSHATGHTGGTVGNRLRIEGTCTAPSITTQPASATKCLGDSVTFSVTATGTPLLYQWKKGGTDISGATDSSYTISAVGSGDAGDYTCYVWNGCGNETSEAAALTVETPPTAPTSANANPDTISSSQSSTLSYSGGQGDTLKWYKGGCGSGESIGSGNNLQVSPTETTTYYCRWESDVCDPSSCVSVTVTVQSALVIGDAKKKADNESVSVSEKVVTAVFDDHFYIEEDDRSSGIRIIPSAMPSGLAVGDIVSVNGTIETSSDNERYIDAGSVTIIDSGTPLEPVGMTSKALGGGDTLEYNASTGAGQRGVEDGAGANTIGLLVKITGEVTASGDDYFYIQDGYEARDFSIFRGIRVTCPGIEKPDSGTMQSVVGISQTMKIEGRVFRTLRTRGSADIVTYQS